LLKIFQCFTVLLRPIQGRTEEKIGVVEQIWFGIGAKEPAQDRDGFFRLPGIDQPLRLSERRIVRGRAAFGRVGARRCSRGRRRKGHHEDVCERRTGSAVWPQSSMGAVRRKASVGRDRLMARTHENRQGRLVSESPEGVKV